MDVATMKKDLENQIGDINKELENIYLPHDAVLILLGKRTAFGIALKLVDSLRLEQKPARSKNDTVFLNEITDFFENETVRLQHDLGMYAHWLKSLPERFNLTPKQEWSEEDEDMLNSCISSIEEAKENRYAYKETDGDTSYDHEIAWLKSLRPSWRPSEEQMEALKCAVEDVAEFSKRGGRQVELENEPYYSALQSLYCNLEKLM